MRFTTKTEYGLVALIYIAKNSGTDLVNIREIMQKEQLSIDYMEKILQLLRQANILKSKQGKQGGYTLSRDASQITLKEIVDALEGGTFEVFCEPEMRKDIVCTHFSMCSIRPIWTKTKEVLDRFFGSITLEMIVKEEFEVRELVQNDGAGKGK